MDFEKSLAGFQLMGDVSSDAVLIYGVNEKQFIYLNKVASVMFQTDGDQLALANSVLEHVHDEDRDYLRRKYEQLILKNYISNVEFRIARNRPVRYLSSSAYLLNQTHILCFVRDVSDLKENENYMIEFGARKNAMLEIIMHSLRGPLYTMQNVTTQFNGKPQKSQSENLPVYLDLIKSGTTHCIDLIADLLKTEHDESVETQVKKIRFNVIEKMDIIYQELTKAYDDRIFSFPKFPKSVFVSADEVKFLQVVNILTSNALKFTSMGDRISIEVREMETHVIIKISDNGIGIPEALQPFIFDYKSSASRIGLDGQASTGIGLSITKKLVSIMGGRIWCESKEGEGSDFFFTLPKD